MATEEEKLLNEAKKFPWEQRLLHMNWKVRSEANVDLASVCSSITDPKDSRLKEFGPLFKKMVADSNAAVQEKALDALIAFLTAADADISRYAKEVCDTISAKCLTGRPKTVEKAQAVFLLWVELEASEAFLDSMEKAVKNKVAKAVVPAIDVMFQALSEFGAKVVPPKRILKMLPELFHHSDQYVRASSKGLTLELCRWIGKEPVKSILFEKMQNTMKKELETELENVTGIARPTRKLRSQQEKELEQELVTEASEAGPSGKSLDYGPQEIDEFDLVDPVDILTPLGKSGFWNGVKATKWSERRDAVAELTKLASTKKIAHGDFTEVSRTLKKLVGEVNIAVAVEAIQAIGNLAKGLRNNFGKQSRFLLPVLLEKLKDKKPISTEALTQTLQTMYKSGCFTLPDVIEEIKASVKNKVPLVRSSTLNWVKFCVEASNKSTVLKLQKEYVPICMECLNDGTPDVRDSSFAALAAIAKIVGMKPLEKSLEKLDEVKKKKLSDMIGPANAVKESISKPSTGGSVQNTSGILTVRSAASMLTGEKPVQATSNNAKKSEKGKPDNSKKTGKNAPSKASLSVMTEDTEPINLSLEEIEDKLSNVINADMVSKLKSGVWKERLEGISMLKEEIDKISNLDQYTELLISLLCSVPGWSEKNVQVQQRLIELITNISTSAKQLPKRCVVQCLFGISERLGDIKTRADAIKCLTAFSEAVGPGFVFARMYKIIKEHTNPKVLSEGILWMISAVEDFGVSNLNLKDLIAFCKDTGLQSNAVATRNATVKLIGALHKFVGPDIKGFLSDVSPTLLSAIDTEFQKNPYEGSAATPKRKIKSCDAITVMPSLDFDSLPREDISSKITPSLLKDIASPHWKVRLDSIESVNKILEQAHKKIQPIGTAELFGALKGRLHDSNKNIVMATLSTIGSLASALGPPVENSSKGILVDVLKCLGDNKKHMGESTLNTLDSWIAATHLTKMVPYIVTCLSDSKTGAEGRTYLFDWLLKQIPKLNDSSEALLLVKPVAFAFVDKSSEIRKSAESVLIEILKACGKEAVTKGVKDLPKPVLTALAERLNLPCMPDDASDSSVKISVTKAWKSGPLNYGQGSKIGGISRPSSPRGAPMRGSTSIDSSTIKAMTNEALKSLKPSRMNDKQGLNLNKPTSQEPKLGNRPSSSKGANMRALNSNNHPVQDSSNVSKALKPAQKNGKTGLNGPSSSRGGSMKGSNSVSSLQDLVANSQPLFNTSNSNKDKREKTFTHKFKFDDLRPEQLQHLENDLLKHVREDVTRRLLSKDFTKQVDAIDLLLKGLPSSGKEMIELLDVLLRWFVLRLCESNTTILMKAAEFLHDLFDFLKDQAYIFTETEAEMFLPCLIEKCGHNQEKIRAKARELTKQTIGIYPASKLLNYTLESSRSKNNRTRTECADLIGYLIDNHFSEISGQMKSLKIIAGLVAERDSELRKSALNTLAIAYENLGDDVWKYIGKVGDPQKSMIDERFKWKAREMQKKSQSKPVEKLRETVIEEDVESIVSVDTCMEKSIQHVETGPTNLRNALDIVVLAELPQSVEGMKIIFHELSQAMADPKSSVIKELVEETDRLVSCFTKLVPSSFNHRISGGSSRPCKYVLNILLRVFQIKSVAQTVSERTLEELVTELLTWLLDKRVSQMDDGSQFYNALNMLVPKILENADTTSCFIVLLKLLRPVPTIPESLALRNNHFSELVIICLTKMTKVVETKIREVDLERILQSVCLYFNMLKPDEIQRSPVVDITHKLISLANSRAYSECGSTVSTGSAGS